MIRVGVIGYGYWGPNIVRNFHGVEGSRVQMVCDKSPDMLRRVAQNYPDIQTTTNADDVLTSPQIDAVAVITPVWTHFELAKKALENGKHVFVEKPFTSDVAQAEELIELAEKKGLVIMVDHTFLFTGAVKKMRQLIDEQVLGKLYYYDSTRVNLGLFQHDVNVIWDLAPHALAARTQVLARIKAEGGRVAHGTRPLPGVLLSRKVLGAMSLASIFYHDQAIPFRQFENGIHVCHLSVEMDRHNRRHRAPFQCEKPSGRPINRTLSLKELAKFRDVDVVSVFVYINKLRFSASLGDRFSGSDKGVWHRNHNIAGLHTCRDQGEAQRIRSAVHPNALTHFTEACERALKVLYQRTTDKAGAPDHRDERRDKFLLELSMRTNKI